MPHDLADEVSGKRSVDYRLRESADSSDEADDRQSRCRPPTRADDILGKRSTEPPSAKR
jgi:hypothetical protein